MSRWVALLFALLPSSWKVRWLRWRGHDVHPSAYIGFSILNAERIEIGEDARILHGNVFSRVHAVRIGAGSTIGYFNRITCARGETGTLTLGKNVLVTLRHYFNLSADIVIGDNSTIGGHRTELITHGLAPSSTKVVRRGITIGDWCSVGSSVCLVPGAAIAEGTFVGMGAVVVGQFQETYVLLGGSPATIKKKLDPQMPFFTQGPLDPRRREDAAFDV